jgi:hypothetical protein
MKINCKVVVIVITKGGPEVDVFIVSLAGTFPK